MVPHPYRCPLPLCPLKGLPPLMDRLISPRPVALQRSPSGAPVSWGWCLRLLTLLVGVMSMHLWIGPGSEGMAGSIHGSSPVSVSAAVVSPEGAPAGTLESPPGSPSHRAGATGLVGPALAAVSEVTAADHGSSDTSLCADTCPNGHSMMTAMCLIALLVIGALTFLWLRSALLTTGTRRRGPPEPTIIRKSRPQTVSLVQLSISRT